MAELRKLGKDVYVYLQPPLVWYSNAGVIIGERDVIVVDSLTNSAMAQSLLAEIREVTDKPIRFLINTHAHADHTYTNHFFPEATVICSHRCREQTKANQKAQCDHEKAFTGFFPDVDFRGGRYTLQDMGFSGGISLYRGENEVRVLELGPGHSESDVVVHLPEEKLVFCGDIFVNGMPPLPGEGNATRTIAQYNTIEALEAEIYVAGHGDPGTLADVRAQRIQLEGLFQYAKECFEQGMSYDSALQTLADNPIPMDFLRLTILSSYCELMGRMPETTDSASQSHLTLLQGIATEAKILLGRKG